MDSIGLSVRRLIENHRRREPFVPLAKSDGDDLAVAYAIQQAYVEARCDGGDAAIAGWKIGLNSRRLQTRVGVSEPVAGTVNLAAVHGTGATIPAARYVHLGLEMEICVRLGTGIEHTSGGSWNDVAACIDAVGAAFEIVDDRDADYARLDPFTLVADNVWNEGAVLAEMVPYREAGPLTGRTGVLSRNGGEIARGQYDAENGDVAAIVAWLARSVRGRGGALRPGQIVMTGTLFSPIFPVAGDVLRYEVEGLAPVVLHIS